MAVARKSPTKKPASKTVSTKKSALAKKKTSAETPKLAAKESRELQGLQNVAAAVLITFFLDLPRIQPSTLAPEGLKLSPAAALCLSVIGANPGTCTEFQIHMKLRSSYSREEAWTLVGFGIDDLIHRKLAKYMVSGARKKAKTIEEVRGLHLALTAKGQKVFDLLRKNLAASMP